MMEWISVEDRLPEVRFGKSVRCLVLVQKAVGGFLSDTYEMEIVSYTDSNISFGNYFEGMKTPGIVTHWMPLPEPPKEA